MKRSKVNIIINISGGNNQILPNATHAEQHFHGHVAKEPQPKVEDLDTAEYKQPASYEIAPFASYVKEVEVLDYYCRKMSFCTSARLLADIVMEMLINDSVKVDKDEIVRQRFINTLLPLCPQITTGRTISNVRAYINDALAKMKKKN